jgi:tRNA pseudouridine38-40 synthase
VRIALGLEYDGRGFAGWQRQSDLPTVQLAVESAIAAIAGHEVTLHAAGRTDRGVHALLQVAHFDTDADRPETAWVRGVNSHLPQGIAVLWATVVEERFHARFSATGRHYRYLMLDHPVRPALAAGQLGWYHAKLDVEAMAAACLCLLGEHDFSSFRASECQSDTPVKEVRYVSVQRLGGLIEFRFSANGFLHHMVRNLVGSLVAIGSHRQPVEWMAELLFARDRTIAAPTFAPDGLYLSKIDYPAEFNLPLTQPHCLLSSDAVLAESGFQ